MASSGYSSLPFEKARRDPVSPRISCDRRPLYYRGGRSGRAEDRVDGTALHGSQADQKDHFHRLAKVRVEGSNPVFRSLRTRHLM